MLISYHISHISYYTSYLSVYPCLTLNNTIVIFPENKSYSPFSHHNKSPCWLPFHETMIAKMPQGVQHYPIPKQQRMEPEGIKPVYPLSAYSLDIHNKTESNHKFHYQFSCFLLLFLSLPLFVSIVL